MANLPLTSNPQVQRTTGQTSINSSAMMAPGGAIADAGQAVGQVANTLQQYEEAKIKSDVWKARKQIEISRAKFNSDVEQQNVAAHSADLETNYIKRKKLYDKEVNGFLSDVPEEHRERLLLDEQLFQEKSLGSVRAFAKVKDVKEKQQLFNTSIKMHVNSGDESAFHDSIDDAFASGLITEADIKEVHQNQLPVLQANAARTAIEKAPDQTDQILAEYDRIPKDTARRLKERGREIISQRSNDLQYSLTYQYQIGQIGKVDLLNEIDSNGSILPRDKTALRKIVDTDKKTDYEQYVSIMQSIDEYRNSGTKSHIEEARILSKLQDYDIYGADATRVRSHLQKSFGDDGKAKQTASSKFYKDISKPYFEKQVLSQRPGIADYQEQVYGQEFQVGDGFVRANAENSKFTIDQVAGTYALTVTNEDGDDKYYSGNLTDLMKGVSPELFQATQNVRELQARQELEYEEWEADFIKRNKREPERKEVVDWFYDRDNAPTIMFDSKKKEHKKVPIGAEETLSYFESLDSVGNDLTGEAKIAFDEHIATSNNPKELQAKYALASFYALETGEDLEEVYRNWDMYRNDLIKVMGIDSRDDINIYNQVATVAKSRSKDISFLKQTSTQAILDFISGKESSEAYKSYITETAVADMRPELSTATFGTYKQSYESAQKVYGKNKDAINRVFKYMVDITDITDEDVDKSEIIHILANAEDDDLMAIFSAAEMMATHYQTEDKGGVKQFGEAFSRVFVDNIQNSLGLADTLQLTSFALGEFNYKASDIKRSDYKNDYEYGRALAFDVSSTQVMPAGGSPFPVWRKKMTAQDKRVLKEWSTNMLAAKDNLNRIKNIAYEELDPIKGGWAGENVMYPVASSLGYIGTAAIPLSGFGIVTSATAEQISSDMRQKGVPIGESVSIGLIGGTVVGGLERLSTIPLFKGKLNTVVDKYAQKYKGKLIKGLTAGYTKDMGWKGIVSVAAYNQIIATGQEVTTETLQEVTPLVLQELISDVDVSKEEWDSLKDVPVSVILPTVVLTSIQHAGFKTRQDYKAASKIIQEYRNVLEVQLPDSSMKKVDNAINTGDDKVIVDTLQSEYDKRDNKAFDQRTDELNKVMNINTDPSLPNIDVSYIDKEQTVSVVFENGVSTEVASIEDAIALAEGYKAKPSTDRPKTETQVVDDIESETGVKVPVGSEITTKEENGKQVIDKVETPLDLSNDEIKTPKIGQDGLGISNRATKQVRRAMDLAELPSAEKQSTESLLKGVIAREGEDGVFQYADNAVNRVLKGGEALNEQEVVAVWHTYAQKINEFDVAQQAIVSGKHVFNEKDLMKRAEDASLAIDNITRALQSSGSKTAKALARRSLVMKADGSFLMDPQRAISKMSAVAKRDLTMEEKQKIIENSKQFKELVEREEAYIKRIEELEKDKEKQANKWISQSKSNRKRAKDPAKRGKKRISDAKQQLQALGYRTGIVSRNSSPEVARLLKEIALGHIEQGADTLKDVISLTTKDAPDFSDVDIIDSIAGKSTKEVKKRVLEQAEKRRAGLVTLAKAESRVIDKLNDLTKSLNTDQLTTEQYNDFKSETDKLVSEMVNNITDRGALEKVLSHIDNALESLNPNIIKRDPKEQKQTSEDISNARDIIKFFDKKERVKERISELKEALEDNKRILRNKPQEGFTTEQQKALEEERDKLQTRYNTYWRLSETLDRLNQKIDLQGVPRRRHGESILDDKDINELREKIKAVRADRKQDQLLAKYTEQLENLGEATKALPRKINPYRADVKAAKAALDEAIKVMNLKESIAKLKDAQERAKKGDYSGLNLKTEERIATESEEVMLLKIEKQKLVRANNQMALEIKKQTEPQHVLSAIRGLRTLAATADFSYPRQMVLYMASHPKVFAKSIPVAFKAGLSEDNFTRTDIKIKSGLSFDTFDIEMKVGLTEEGRQRVLERERAGLQLTSNVGDIQQNEEDMMGRFGRNIKYFKSVMDFSERSMITGQNFIRASVFDHALTKDSSMTQEQKNQIARVINITSGRGDFKTLGDTAEFLGVMFFAPRFAISRVHSSVLIPEMLIRGFKNGKFADKTQEHIFNRDYLPALKETMMQQIGTVVTGGMLLALIDTLPGVDVGTDPSDKDFGKIVFRDSGRRIDMWGGFAQIARVYGTFAKEVMGQKPKTTPLKAAQKFITYKASPAFSAFYISTTGRNVMDMEVDSRLLELGAMIFPLAWRDMYEGGKYAYETGDYYELLFSGLNLFGISSNIYEKK